MNKDRFDFAIKDNQYIHIDNFKSGVGFDCGCYCPVCGERVQSNIRRSEESNFTNRFSHASNSCDGGHGETELHKLAKKILEENNSLRIPPITDFHSPLTYERVTLEPSIKSTRAKQFRPDIILYTSDNRKVAIEIYVTHPVSNEKAELFAKKELACVEIDLSEFHLKDIDKYNDDIEDAILRDLVTKKWIWPVQEESADEPKKSKENQDELSWVDVIKVIIAGWLICKGAKWVFSIFPFRSRKSNTIRARKRKGNQ